MNLRVSLLMGCATSWYVPSGRFRLGIATNIPLVPSMILRPRITKASLNVMLANALSLSSSLSDTRTSVISSVITCHPPRVPDLDPSKSFGHQPQLCLASYAPVPLENITHLAQRRRRAPEF